MSGELTRILLVDDSKMFQALFVHALTDSGHEVLTCNSGADALALLGQREVDFICSSFYLSDMEGSALCRAVRARPGYARKPFVLLTSVDDQERLNLALPAGVTDIFHKRDVEQLIVYIRRFVFARDRITGRVLYVEDSATQRMATCALLESHGLTVDACATVAEALARIDQQDYDLVLTDIVLDGQMSGVNLVNRLRRRTDHRGDVPVLAMTAFDDPARRLDLFSLGISDYLIKPVVIEELCVRVGSIIARRRLLDSIEQASQAKSEFVASMSHEIRTPMNAVLGLTHQLRRQQHDDATQATLGKIEDAAHYLLSIINDILDLSKIEAGKMHIEAADFEMAQVMRTLEALLGERIAAKGLAFRVDIAALPARLHGDGLRLGQILLNFVGNAVKFTEAGQITLSANVVARHAESLRVRFSVRDSGIGLTPEQLGRLFTAFEQAESSTSRRFGGTGLGLAICKRLAEMMDGKVGAESRPGEGSTFWVELPFGHAAPDAAASPPAEALPLADIELRLRATPGRRVLLAEDSPLNQEVAMLLLEDVGLAVDLAENGEDAVRLATRQDYHLILMDMQMPVMDGLTAARQIRDLPRHTATPIIAMTGNAGTEDQARCLAAGMNDHIAKPVDPGVLYGKLHRWLP